MMILRFLPAIRTICLILPLGLPLGLTGCWGGDSGAMSAPQQSVTSRFVAGQGGAIGPGTIETVVVDPLPVEAAHLVMANGTTLAATEISREKNAYTDDGDGGPHVAVGASGGSQTRVTTGIGIEFPFFGGGGGGTRSVSMTTSTLTFRVPDMAAYDREWQRWILHIDLSDGANHRTIETLPPKPPRDG